MSEVRCREAGDMNARNLHASVDNLYGRPVVHILADDPTESWPKRIVTLSLEDVAGIAAYAQAAWTARQVEPAK